MDIFNLVPALWKSVFQIFEVKRGSRSDIISFGHPKITKKFSNNKFAVSSAVTVCDVGINRLYLENLSTTVKMASCPLSVSGKWVTKSIVIVCSGLGGIGKGLSNPYFFCVFVLELLICIQPT